MNYTAENRTIHSIATGYCQTYDMNLVRRTSLCAEGSRKFRDSMWFYDFRQVHMSWDLKLDSYGTHKCRLWSFILDFHDFWNQKKSSCLPSRSQESYNQGAYATSRKCFLGAEVPMSMPVVSGCVSFYNARLNKVKSRDPLVSIYSPSILIYSPLDFQWISRDIRQM